MPELTRASMHDARDAEDTRLLEAGGVRSPRRELLRRDPRSQPDQDAAGGRRDRRGGRGRDPPPLRAQARPAVPRALPGRRPPGDQVEGEGALPPGKIDEVEFEDWVRKASTESTEGARARAR